MEAVTKGEYATHRTFHVIDIENLIGEQHALPIDSAFAPIYRRVTGASPEDLLLVGADHRHAFGLRLAFPSAQVVIGRGTDGADDALIHSVDLRTVARGHDTIVLATGDHRFAGLAHGARLAGLEVVVVSKRRSLNRLLAAEADRVLEFPSIDWSLPFDLTTAA